MRTSKWMAQRGAGIAAVAAAAAVVLGVVVAGPAAAVQTCTLIADASNVPLYDNPGGEAVRNVDVAADWSSEQGVFQGADKSGDGAAAMSLWVRVKDGKGGVIGYFSVVEGGVRCSGGF